ncbi:MAG: hypothetical protein GXY60_04650 [Spirochaetales bacterium]|nr:hypothetical protein [Spirochaetales bacterium]
MRCQRKCIAWIVSVIVLCTAVTACSCSLEDQRVSDGILTVMTYNVCNLFDTVTDGTEYPEYTPEAGWTVGSYGRRLELISQAIVQGQTYVPDIVVLQEIEHERVMQALVERHLSAYGLRWLATTSDAESAIQVGIVSRYPIQHAVVHGIDGLRSILEVEIETPVEPICLFALHAKSQREGEKVTEPLRILTMAALKDAIEQRLKYNSQSPILVAGDFNESADAYYRWKSEFPTALVPATDSHAPLYERQGSILITGAPPVRGQWYSWWLDPQQFTDAEATGSYWYKGVWESFDQILASSECFDGKGWDFDCGHVKANKQICDPSGIPYVWDERRRTGFSDHLPVYIVLKACN